MGESVKCTHSDSPSHVGSGLCHVPLPSHKRTPYPTRLYPESHLTATAQFNGQLPLLQLDNCTVTVPWCMDGKEQEAATKKLLIHHYYCPQQVNVCVDIVITCVIPISTRMAHESKNTSWKMNLTQLLHWIQITFVQLRLIIEYATYLVTGYTLKFNPPPLIICFVFNFNQGNTI